MEKDAPVAFAPGGPASSSAGSAPSSCVSFSTFSVVSGTPSTARKRFTTQDRRSTLRPSIKPVCTPGYCRTCHHQQSASQKQRDKLQLRRDELCTYTPTPGAVRARGRHPLEVTLRVELRPVLDSARHGPRAKVDLLLRYTRNRSEHRSETGQKQARMKEIDQKTRITCSSIAP